MGHVLLPNVDWGELSPETSDAEEDLNEGNDDGDEEEEVFAERSILFMPSSLGKKLCMSYGFELLADQEKELRVAQADECLENLRLALGHKSLLLRTSVWGAKGQKGKTRAWNEVERISETIKKEVALYHRAREALVRLEAEENILQKFQRIASDDLKMSGDVVEENRVGQRNDTLAWFWRLDGAGQISDDNWMQECKSFILIMLPLRLKYLRKVYRVNWHRASARYQRWVEEEKIVKSEMKSTIAWFSHQDAIWRMRAEQAKQDGKRGHECYALKQSRLWEQLGKEAKECFQE